MKAIHVNCKDTNILSSKADKHGYMKFACDVCGSTKAIQMPYVLQYTNRQRIHICKTCGFIYVKKRRPFDRIAQIWSKDLFGKAYSAMSPLMLARHTYIAEFIQQKIGLKNKTLCDIGAGEGQFLKVVKNLYGTRPFGIEPSAENCKILKKFGIKYFQGTLEDVIAAPKYKSFNADIVTILWTLENVTSPRDILLGLRSLLKKNGYLVVATGSRILVPFNKPLNFYLSSTPVDSHASRFSFNTLTALLNISGFQVKFVNPYLNDSLALCLIAKKVKLKENVEVNGDDYREVKNFFQRWHQESLRYQV